MCSAIGSGWASSNRTRPPTAHHLGEAVNVERVGNLSKNGPELGLERGAVLPVKSHPDSRPALVQSGHERSRDQVSHARRLARRPDDNSTTQRPHHSGSRRRVTLVVSGDRALDRTEGLLGAVNEVVQAAFGGDQHEPVVAPYVELDLSILTNVVVDGGAISDLDLGGDLDTRITCHGASPVSLSRHARRTTIVDEKHDTEN